MHRTLFSITQEIWKVLLTTPELFNRTKTFIWLIVFFASDLRLEFA